MWQRGWVVLVGVVVLAGCAASAGGQEDAPVAGAETTQGEPLDAGALEAEAVCGSWREPMMAALFRFFAGSANEARVAGIEGVEPVAFTTRDQRTLRGYKLEAEDARGYVLIGLGNAMLADQVIGRFTFLRDLGLEVHIYDYRGYGNSEGKSRFFAIREDYIALIEHLNEAGYDHRFLYGMSLGGVFMTNAVGARVGYDAALIDSPPSRVSGYGCPERFDPVENLPEDTSRLGFIFGEADNVVPPRQWRELAQTAEVAGAEVVVRREFAHPMMDESREIARERFALIERFFEKRLR